MKKSILVVTPAYHYSFFLVKELRKLGWRADVYKPHGYPELFLYDSDYISERTSENIWTRQVVRIILFLKIALRYKYFLIYGSVVPEPFMLNRRYEQLLFPPNVSIGIYLLKMLKKKLIFFPSGCIQEVLRVDFQKHEDGNVCSNCGYDEDVCDDKRNQISFDIVNKYYDFIIANSPIVSNRIKKNLVKHRTLDLEIFRPDLEIPSAFRLPARGNLRVLHAFYDQYRQHGGKNIKGSPHVLSAIERLKSEGYPLEYYYLNDVPAKHMRYYQAQADIVVDQLIYGWWGSTAIEAMALGKPVVCYLSPLWKKLFLEGFPEYTSLPIVEANTENIYEVLRKLATNKEYRKVKGEESRQFAEKHFDVKKNARELEKIFLNL